MPESIPLDQLHSHPDNPRLFLRDEVIDSIAAQIKNTGQFDEAHALLVRPVNGGYQIIQGHHRRAAADKAGLKRVPCWVREMTDDEAKDLLFKGNIQAPYTEEEYKRWLKGWQKFQDKKIARLLGRKPKEVRRIKLRGAVYIIAAVNLGMYKIGHTSRGVQSRLIQLQTSSPFDLYVVSAYFVDNSKKVEKALHQHFDIRLKRGEWFELSSEQVSEAIFILKNSKGAIYYNE
jgi:ParB/RepB/Spo0J family partition protein